MKLYYYRTDGGAEYHTTKENDLYTTVLRTDGNEIEVFTDNIKRMGINLKIKGEGQHNK